MDSFSSATTAAGVGTPHRLSEEALVWLKVKRKISKETLAKLPVASGITFFPELKRKSDAIFFRYGDGYKARSFPEKAFTCKPGTTQAYWNLEQVLAANPAVVYITEGEMDACALVESGIAADAVIAAPSASGGTLEYVEKALAAGLSRAKKFVWCGDQDDVGLELRALTARMIGIARFHFVSWPEGIKDANEYLIKDGARALYDLVMYGYLPWPTNGLYKLSELPEPPPMTLWNIGFKDFDNRRLKLGAGTLSVATGHPGMGKTLLWGQIWFQVARDNDLMVCVASFETRPRPHLRRQLRTLYARRAEHTLDGDDDVRIKEADRWIDDHYRFVVHPERRPDLGWLLQMAEAAVIRNGARVLQIDPWNRLEAAREDKETETEYISRCLRALYNFATDFDCHVQIIAHPSKVDHYRRTDPPELEDIAGCYSSDTEVLTRRGWIAHPSVTLDDEVACFNTQADRIEYHRPSKLHVYRYRGEMFRFLTKATDLLVTPNHRMVVAPGWPEAGDNAIARIRWAADRWHFVEARNLTKARWVMPIAAKLDNRPAGDTMSESLLEFIGWWIAEGSESQRGVSICQAVGPKADRIKALMEAVPFDFTEHVAKYRPDELPVWRARILKRSHPEISEWILRECGVGCENKRLPAIVWDLSDAGKRAVFDGLMGGDGSVTRNPDGRCYTTTSRQLGDDVQRLAIELGHTAQVRCLGRAEPHHKDRYQVNIGGRNRTTITLLTERHLTTGVPYDGTVYCLTTTTGAYVTRRNGRMAIAGNSKHWHNMVDQGFVVHRPQLFDDKGERQTYCELHHKKARFDELGYATKFGLDFDIDAGRFGVCPLRETKRRRKKKDNDDGDE